MVQGGRKGVEEEEADGKMIEITPALLRLFVSRGRVDLYHHLRFEIKAVLVRYSRKES